MITCFRRGKIGTHLKIQNRLRYPSLTVSFIFDLETSSLLLLRLPIERLLSLTLLATLRRVLIRPLHPSVSQNGNYRSQKTWVLGGIAWVSYRHMRSKTRVCVTFFSGRSWHGGKITKSYRRLARHKWREEYSSTTSL